MNERVSPLKRNAWRLGVAGLVPFVALAVLAWLPDEERARAALAWQVQYGAMILTFVGAIHWGVVLTERMLSPSRTAMSLLWSVMPGLFAWAVTTLPADRALALLVTGLVAAFVVDAALYRDYSVPRWFIGLRFILTVVACVSLLVTWFAPVARG